MCLTGAEVGDGDPVLVAPGPELEVEAADAGVVDEHVAVGVPPHRHRRVLLLGAHRPAAIRSLRRGGCVEEVVLEHNASLGHRERRDRGVPVRLGHPHLARSLCVCVLRWCNRVTGADLWLESLGIGGKGFKCGEEGWRRPAGLEFGMEASAFGLHRNG